MTLKSEVIKDLEEYTDLEEKKRYLGDLLKGGCQSGIASRLIYYKDTNAFYDKHEEEIEDLVQQYITFARCKRSEFISSLNGDAEDITQEKNLLSWFAYEETCRTILDLLEDGELL